MRLHVLRHRLLQHTFFYIAYEIFRLPAESYFSWHLDPAQKLASIHPETSFLQYLFEFLLLLLISVNGFFVVLVSVVLLLFEQLVLSQGVSMLMFVQR